MVRDGKAIGAIVIVAHDAGRFDDKQIALLQTFADQAVIAIENVRLFNETKEALEQQTATAEVLQRHQQSPTDVQPVFDAIAGAAARLFAHGGAVIPRRRRGPECVAATPWPMPVTRATAELWPRLPVARAAVSSCPTASARS